MPKLLATLCKELGYMRQDDALAHGFTHHGNMYGVPCWIGMNSGGPMVAAKWGPMEHVISVGHWFMGLHSAITGTEPAFRIGIGEAIHTD